MKSAAIFTLTLFSVLIVGNFISAACSSSQININTASASELDALYGIGPSKAQAIIDYRTNQSFSSVGNLINVKGIGSVTLSNIKAQGLACVGDLEENSSENSSQAAPSENTVNIQPTDSRSNGPSIVQPQVISLNSNASNAKAINSNGVLGDAGARAFYGFVAFSVVIIGLLLTKKRKYKNEFQDGRRGKTENQSSDDF